MSARIDRGKRKSRPEDEESEESEDVDFSMQLSEISGGAPCADVVRMCFSKVDGVIDVVQCVLSPAQGNMVGTLGQGKKNNSKHISWFKNKGDKTSHMHTHLQKYHSNDISALASLNDKDLAGRNAGIKSILEQNAQRQIVNSQKPIVNYLEKKSVSSPDRLRVNVAAILMCAEKDTSIEIVSSRAFERVIESCGGKMFPNSRTVLTEKYLPLTFEVCRNELREGVFQSVFAFLLSEVNFSYF
jgi:hypothetical protein